MSDLISRQAAIDALLGITAMRNTIPLDSAIFNIKKLPSAQPKQRWIPCSETTDIPENEVLCCDRYGNEMIGYLAYTDEQWLCESDAEMMYDTVAWMEKPKPWRGEEHE